MGSFYMSVANLVLEPSAELFCRFLHKIGVHETDIESLDTSIALSFCRISCDAESLKSKWLRIADERTAV